MPDSMITMRSYQVLDIAAHRQSKSVFSIHTLRNPAVFTPTDKCPNVVGECKHIAVN